MNTNIFDSKIKTEYEYEYIWLENINWVRILWRIHEYIQLENINRIRILWLIFLHDFTLFVIDMHQNRSLSTFLTPFDHFQKRVFGKLISWHLPRCCHIKFCFCVFMTTRISHDASKTCLGMWRISFMFARLWKLLTFLSCILFPLLSQNFVNISCLTFSFVLLFWRCVDVYVVASAANRARCVTDAYVF